MRNRITLKGFRKWLMRQKNDTRMYCGSHNTCPVAQYIGKVFNTSDVRVGIQTRLQRGIPVATPKIFESFIRRFDARRKSTAQSAKIVLKQILKENNIVDVKGK